MADATAVSPEELASGEASLHPLQSLAERLGRELQLKDFGSGRWFPKLVAAYLRHREAQKRQTPREEGASRPAAAQAIIRRACSQAALTGAGCGTLSTGAAMFIADTGPTGALVAVPVAGLAIGGEMLLRSIIHLRMTCDLADAFGVPFQPDDPVDISLLHALVLKAERHEEPRDSGQKLLDRLVHSEALDLGEEIGSRLLGESVARNIIPFLGVATSSLTNWRRTSHLGETVLLYARFRRALDDAFEAVQRRWEDCAELLIEGAWFLFTADQALTEGEAAVLAHLLRRAGPGLRERVMERLVESEGDWLHRLRTVPERARSAFLHALYVLSAASLAAPRAELRFLRQSAQALKRPFGHQEVERLLQSFRTKGVAPVLEGMEAERGVHEEEAPRGEA